MPLRVPIVCRWAPGLVAREKRRVPHRRRKAARWVLTGSGKRIASGDYPPHRRTTASVAADGAPGLVAREKRRVPHRRRAAARWVLTGSGKRIASGDYPPHRRTTASVAADGAPGVLLMRATSRLSTACRIASQRQCARWPAGLLVSGSPHLHQRRSPRQCVGSPDGKTSGRRAKGGR